MIETSSLYKTLFNAGAMQEYQIEIEGVMYDQYVIYDKTEISENLFDTSTFTIGSFTVSSLKVKLWLENHVIPRNAEVKFYYRYVSDVEQSEWILKFVGNVVDRTRYTDEITTIEAYSKAANYDVFLNHFGSAISSYPANARTVANLCATHLGLTIENIEDIYDGNIVEYPNELTMVQVLQNIAKSSGGNWAIVGEDKLRLVVLENTTPTLEYPTQTIAQSELLSPISMVRTYWKDDSAFEAGEW